MDFSKNFINNMDYFLNKKGVNRKEFAKAVNIPYSTVCSWFNEFKIPYTKNWETIADYFGVDVFSLFGSNAESVQVISEETTRVISDQRRKAELLQELVTKASKLNNSQIECLTTMASTLSSAAQ